MTRSFGHDGHCHKTSYVINTSRYPNCMEYLVESPYFFCQEECHITWQLSDNLTWGWRQKDKIYKIELIESSDIHRCAWGGVDSRSTPLEAIFWPSPLESISDTHPGQQVFQGQRPHNSPIQMKRFFLACGRLRLCTVSWSILVTIFIFLVTIFNHEEASWPFIFK